MAFQDFLFRARRPASLIAFNAAIPANFALVHKPESDWIERPGVNISTVDSLEMKAAEYDGDGNETAARIDSPDVHYNIRVTEAWSGWAGIHIDPEDPDFEDDLLDRLKLKQCRKKHGVYMIWVKEGDVQERLPCMRVFIFVTIQGFDISCAHSDTFSNICCSSQF